MRAVLLGDTHFGVRGGDLNFLEFQVNWFRKMVSYMVDNDLNYIIQAGDWFDVRKSIDQRVLYMMYMHIIPLLRQHKINVTMIAGNHDIYYRNNNEIHSSKILEMMAPDVFTVYSKITEMGDWLFVPWLDETNALEFPKAIKQSKAKYVIGHFEIEGAQMYTGSICEHGMKASELNGFETVFSGHFHCISNYMGIQYLGSPYAMTWADVPDGTNRGFWVFEDGKATLIQNTEQDTLFSILKYDPEVDYKEGSLDDYKGKIIKVIVDERKNERHYKKFIGVLNTLNTVDFRVIDNTIIETKPVEVKQETLELDTLGVFKEYIDSQTDIDVVAVKNLAEAVYFEALQ